MSTWILNCLGFLLQLTARTLTAAPDVNVTTVLQIHPGAAAQTLHRDVRDKQACSPFINNDTESISQDVLFHPHRPAVATWDRLRENTTLNFVALDKVTARNGGARSLLFTGKSKT